MEKECLDKKTKEICEVIKWNGENKPDVVMFFNQLIHPSSKSRSKIIFLYDKMFYKDNEPFEIERGTYIVKTKKGYLFMNKKQFSEDYLIKNN